MAGKVYLIGIGSCSLDDFTPRAATALRRAEVVIMWSECFAVLSPLMVGKECISADLSPLERSEIAITKAKEGRVVAILSMGDPGVYAIASTFFYCLRQSETAIEVEVVPGVTAASSAAALLGSPLGHDVATISLGDLATSWEQIKERFRAACAADFVIVIYNPLGKTGTTRLDEVIRIAMAYRTPATPVGIVTDIGMPAQQVVLTDVSRVCIEKVNPASLLIIGNSQTFIWNGFMVTPRHYQAGLGY